VSDCGLSECRVSDCGMSECRTVESQCGESECRTVESLSVGLWRVRVSDSGIVSVSGEKKRDTEREKIKRIERQKHNRKKVRERERERERASRFACAPAAVRWPRPAGWRHVQFRST
jgi:hypothetical protein